MPKTQTRSRRGQNGRDLGRLSAGAAAALDCTVRAGARSYDRRRDLPALIRTDPFAPPPDTPEGVAEVVARIERALRAERNRARSGHWTYDLNRHIALHQALAAETRLLAELRAKQ